MILSKFLRNTAIEYKYMPDNEALEYSMLTSHLIYKDTPRVSAAVCIPLCVLEKSCKNIGSHGKIGGEWGKTSTNQQCNFLTKTTIK